MKQAAASYQQAEWVLLKAEHVVWYDNLFRNIVGALGAQYWCIFY